MKPLPVARWTNWAMKPLLFIYIYHIHLFHGNIWTHNWPAPKSSGFIAQLVRASHRYREVMGSNPIKSGIFFRLLAQLLLTQLRFIYAVLIWFVSYTSITIQLCWFQIRAGAPSSNEVTPYSLRITADSGFVSFVPDFPLFRSCILFEAIDSIVLSRYGRVKWFCLYLFAGILHNRKC